MQVSEQVSLAPYTTFGIGGPARWFVEASTEDEVLEAVHVARAPVRPLFVLGGGRNLLVSDAGFPGVVLHIGIKGIEQHSHEDTTKFSVAAGEDWDACVSLAVD